MFLLALDAELAKVNSFYETNCVQLTDQLSAAESTLKYGCLDRSERDIALKVFAAVQRELIELRSYTELNYVAGTALFAMTRAYLC